MSNIISYKHKHPEIDENAYVNPYAVVIGEVTVHENVSLWPGVILRADDDRIEVGANTAILDKVLVEAPEGKPVIIGVNVLVSHGAVLHGCIINNGALIGISANILDGAEIGEECVIAAGTLIPPGTKVPPRSKVMGSPGKITGGVTDEDIAQVQKQHAGILAKAKDYGTWFVAKQI